MFCVLPCFLSVYVLRYLCDVLQYGVPRRGDHMHKTGVAVSISKVV